MTPLTEVGPRHGCADQAGTASDLAELLNVRQMSGQTA
jgi:hypothetical protein